MYIYADRDLEKSPLFLLRTCVRHKRCELPLLYPRLVRYSSGHLTHKHNSVLKARQLWGCHWLVSSSVEQGLRSKDPSHYVNTASWVQWSLCAYSCLRKLSCREKMSLQRKAACFWPQLVWVISASAETNEEWYEKGEGNSWLIPVHL